MQDFDAATQEAESSVNKRAEMIERATSFFRYLLQRVVAIVAFGPGILGVLWLLGRIFKKR
jgi:hypothetical protein